ncbi:aldolase catalytic domain-containing protein [Methanomethylophilus alvi]|uniref:aldolase catalytic domain-containing protein n=1 Tax=Methanomethylophilus alvi TaxID=1291540 RepID=UPI0037DC2A3C
MRGNIKLLDCTLRDGGYVNDWKFGNSTLTYIFDRLNNANVDIVEIGFLDERRDVDFNRTIQPSTQSLNEVYSKSTDKSAQIFAMIDYGTCGIDRIQDKDETILDGIRVIFKKENMHNAINFGKKIMEKGYKLCLQMVSVTSYNDEDVIEFSNHVNSINPFAVGIVDTYGLMHKEQVFHYFEMLDNHLNRSIAIGYHSHNNFQLAYSNSIEVLKIPSERTVILDGTLYGMGKSAGNAPIELLSMHLNEFYGKNYDINQLLEAIDVGIMPIFEQHRWGYSLQFYIAAKNDCHPNYVKYLLDKKTLAVKDVDNILGMINEESKLKYDAEYIESLYLKYVLDSIDNPEYVESLEVCLKGRSLVILGPGKSIVTDRDVIKEHVGDKGPIVIAVNFVPEDFVADFIFVSNSKRYIRMLTSLKTCSSKIIATSNVSSVDRPFDFVVRFDNLISESDEIWDNALVILLNLLRKVGVGSISLAGFDGFTDDLEKNYIDKSFDLSKQYPYLSVVNERLTEKIKEYRNSMDIRFLTKSLYDKG